MAMEKHFLIEQLTAQLEASARSALEASEAAAVEAREGATPAEKREDARAAHELGGLGRAQERRAQRALAEIDALRGFRPAAPTANPFPGSPEQQYVPDPPG